jgi:hypothetical protein
MRDIIESVVSNQLQSPEKVKAVHTKKLPSHCESAAIVPASVERVFAHLDDPKRLASHMSESSWKMGGGRMNIEVDENLGQTIGSRIRLAGKVLGIELSVDETVTERTPPHHKVWETTVCHDFSSSVTIGWDSI